MSERFSAVMDGHLVEIFVEKLARALIKAGFSETLRLATPRVSEFQRDSDVIVVQSEHAPEQHKLRLTIESESFDVDLIVDAAAREVVRDIIGQILAALRGSAGLSKTPTGEKGTFLSELEAAFEEWNRRAAT